MERRLAAILCADVVGYSRLMGLDEAGTLGCLKAFETDTVEPVVDCHGGRIVKRMGDGYLVAFTSVVAAVDAALATYRLPKILLAPFRHLGSRGAPRPWRQASPRPWRRHWRISRSSS